MTTSTSRRKVLTSSAALVGAASSTLLIPAQSQAQTGKIRVGLMLPYSGAFAPLGVAIENGVRMAINEQGGKRSVLKWPWKLIHRNTASADASAPSSAKKKKSAEGKSLIVELFNVDRDSTESNNVATANPRIVEELTAYLQQAWRDPK